MNNYLLSICIPTYNRCEVLDITLSSLFNNPEYDSNLIEVIVSDNCSTDSTRDVVKNYPLAKYYCNNENIRDFNYSITLGYASGKYLKLFNDTLSFKKGELKFILNAIETNVDKKVNIFFYQNMFMQYNCVREIQSAKQLIQTVSYSTTWIANFGTWKDDFESIQNRDRYALLQFVQVDWTYRLVNNGKKTVVYFRDFFNVSSPNNKGGYNVFDTFINKYLFIIKEEKLPLLKYEIEKYRLMRYFVMPWMDTLMYKEKNKFSFSTDGVYKIIFGKYWYEFYLYPFLFLVWIKSFKNE